VSPSARRREAVGDGQQFVLPLRKCRIQIIEWRQDPSWLTHIDPERGRVIVNTRRDFSASAHMSPGLLTEFLPT